MKITFLMPVVQQNGGCRVIATYAEELIKRGHDVTVVSRRPNLGSAIRRAVNRVKGVTFTHDDPDRDAYFKSLGPRHVQIDFKEPIEASDMPDADIVIASWWRTAFEVTALPPEKGKKVYFIQHHEVHRHLPWDLSNGTYFLPLHKITIANWLLELMVSRYGDNDVALVPNGIDTQHFSAPPRGPRKHPRVGFLHAPSAFKGVDTCLAALKIVKARFPDLEIVSFGAQPPDEELDLPNGATFHELPPQDDIPKIYADTDVWIVPSRYEGFGLPILEAMACRTPVVATRTGAAPELIEEGVNGYVVDVDDVEALADRVIEVLAQSEANWRDMSESAYKRAQDNSIDKAADRFEAALLKIAARTDGTE